MNQKLFQEILNESYMKRRLKNPSFSIRSFSQRLGINHSALCEIMSGKRKIGLKLGSRLADALMLDEETKSQVLGQQTPRTNQKQVLAAIQLKADQYKVISDWHHFAILSLLETDGSHDEPDWIAKRLQITKTEARDAVGRLQRLGLIESRNQKFILTGRSFASPDGNIDFAVRKTHHQYLELAQMALEATDVEKRDFTAMTMAIDPKKIPEARRRIRKFRDQLCAFLESGEKKEVYEMCFQLFPLSNEV